MSRDPRHGARPFLRAQARRAKRASSKSAADTVRGAQPLPRRTASPLPDAHLRAILASALDCIVTIDERGNILEFNPAAERTFGYVREDVLGQEMAGLIVPPALRERHRAGMKRYLATGEGRYIHRRVETTGMRSDGSLFPVELTVTPTESEGSSIFVAYLRDISERKHAESDRVRLHESESVARAEAERQARQLRAVFEAMSDGVVVYDPEGTVVHTNGAIRKILGVSTALDEYLVQPFRARLRRLHMRDRDERPLEETQWPQVRLVQGETISTDNAVEIILRGLNGVDRRLVVTGGPLRGDDGTLTGAVCVYRDVSTSRSLERELAGRVGVLEATYAAMMDGVATYDASGRVVSVNPALRRLIGIDRYPEYELLPLDQRASWLALFDAEGVPLNAEEWPPARVLRGEVLGGERAMDIVAHTLDGRRAELSVTGTAVRDTDGKIVGAVCVYRDVVFRRAIERQTSAALDTLMRCADVVTTHTARETPADLLGRLATLLLDLEAADFAHAMLVDKQGHLTPIGIYGVSPEHARIWREGVERFHPSALPQLAEITESLATGRPLLQHFDTDRPLISQDTVHSLQVRAAITGPVIVDGRVVGLLAISRTRELESGVAGPFAPWDVDLIADVGRLAGQALTQARLGEQLTHAEAARLAAEAAARQRDEFLSIASHELKTPVTSLKLNLQLAQRRIEVTHTVADDQLSLETLLGALLPRANDQIDRLTRLIDDLLDVSRIATDKLALRIESTELIPIVEEVVAEQRQHNTSRIITLSLPLEPILLRADADRIGQVVTNYLTNALKYSPDNTEVAVTVERDDHLARVSVRDFGAGIPEQEQERIWERFYRSPSIEVQSGSGIGLGLGLFISRSIVERHGGQVGVESHPGEGACFWFTLPLRSGDGVVKERGDAPSDDA